eukprot:3104523-Pyramimonas_sp.AAC.1
MDSYLLNLLIVKTFQQLLRKRNPVLRFGTARVDHATVPHDWTTVLRFCTATGPLPLCRATVPPPGTVARRLTRSGLASGPVVARRLTRSGLGVFQPGGAAASQWWVAWARCHSRPPFEATAAAALLRAVGAGGCL